MGTLVPTGKPMTMAVSIRSAHSQARRAPDHGYLNDANRRLPELPLRRWGREDFVFKKSAIACHSRPIR